MCVRVLSSYATVMTSQLFVGVCPQGKRLSLLSLYHSHTHMYTHTYTYINAYLICFLQFQEIVPDMDDSEFMFNEKQSIRDSSRTLKKYGSTCCNSLRNNEILIRHTVEKTDTLQGISLKYGATVSNDWNFYTAHATRGATNSSLSNTPYPLLGPFL